MQASIHTHMRNVQHRPLKLARQARACLLDGCSQSRKAVPHGGQPVVAASVNGQQLPRGLIRGLGLLLGSPPRGSATRSCKLSSEGSCSWVCSGADRLQQ